MRQFLLVIPAVVLLFCIGFQVTEGKTPEKLKLALFIVNPDGDVNLELPHFLLYESGQVLFRKRSVISQQPNYYTLRIDSARLSAIEQMISELKDLVPEYYVSLASNRPSNIFWCKHQQSEKRILVYGDLSPEAAPIMGNRRDVPLSFLRIYDFLSEFQDPKASCWVPEQIELLLTAVGVSDATDCEWPKCFPPLGTATRDSVIVRLPYTQIREALRLTAARIRAGNRAWRCQLRYVLPDQSQIIDALYR